MISRLKEGEPQVIRGELLAMGSRQSRKRGRFSITEAMVGDESGKISCVWFNQPYLKNCFKVGQEVILYGKVERYSGQLQMSAPEFELVSGEGDGALSAGRIVPVYSLPEGATQRSLRRLIKLALEEYLPRLNDFLPYGIRSRNTLLNLAKALLNIHFPESEQLQQEAYRRLSFEEFLLFQIPLALRKARKKEKPGITHQVKGRPVDDFIAGLPFALTAAQQRVMEEISLDMSLPQAMQRLLQGDVGSGKTVVAVVASIFAIQGGYQAAFMAPTEILAKQHSLVVSRWSFPPDPPSAEAVSEKKIKIGLLTSSMSKAEKARILQEIKEGKIDLVIGTHALLEQGVQFKNLGLVVIDEQHKFGVGQRALLPQKGSNPDVLIMTATPIPRTLAITIYGDLDISVINELPGGRLGIDTVVLPPAQRAKAYTAAREQLQQGHQGYIIYPVIEESYALDIAGAEKMYSRLKSREFKGFRAGLIHGRLKQSEQDELMGKFKKKELDLLVATTVLEVGIDIPNATCMIVENAERFGLAQLHQLRGRIGRGPYKSTCILISDAGSEDARMRLQAMAKYSDGFRIAEEDLKIRGPGEFFGERQHGLAGLKIADPLAQMQLLKKAREEALRLVVSDPRLEERQNIALKDKLLQRFPEYEKLVVVG